MKSLGLLLLLVPLTAAAQVSHMKDPVLGEATTKVSDHVWQITGFPNVAIVVGARATLVVDTGLGPKNGATVARVVTKLAPKNAKLFLATTHFHPEHAGGEQGFPAGTLIVRNTVQQQELEKHGLEMLDMFRGMTAQNKALLEGVVLRTPDITFDESLTLDLGGGVTVRLLWFGGAHTKGDQLALVEPDHTLISGDVVQNKTLPFIFGDGGTPTSWLAVLDKIAKLNVTHVMPDHSPPGDGSLIAAERELLTWLRTQTLALKRQGVTVDAAGKQISADLAKQHPDWADTNAAAFVKSIYNDPTN